MSDYHKSYSRSDAEKGNYSYDSKLSHDDNQMHKTISDEFNRQATLKRKRSRELFIINEPAEVKTDYSTPFDHLFSPRHYYLFLLCIGVVLFGIFAIPYAVGYMSAHERDQTVTMLPLQLYVTDGKEKKFEIIGNLTSGIPKDSLEKILSSLKHVSKTDYRIDNLNVFPKHWVELSDKGRHQNIYLRTNFLAYKKGVPVGQTRTRRELKYY